MGNAIRGRPSDRISIETNGETEESACSSFCQGSRGKISVQRAPDDSDSPRGSVSASNRRWEKPGDLKICWPEPRGTRTHRSSKFTTLQMALTKPELSFDRTTFVSFASRMVDFKEYPRSRVSGKRRIRGDSSDERFRNESASSRPPTVEDGEPLVNQPVDARGTRRDFEEDC